MKLEPKKTERGLYIAEFKDTHKVPCSIGESSAAGLPCLWLGVQGHGMHLRQRHVRELLPLLQRFVEGKRLGDD